ncbi:MAG: hypothetical protein K2R98_17775 [Gemmataceae bacterium]|nr:hypothetical protein [Gemmataceae bacterium]
MIPLSEYFRSVEIIWGLWLASLVILIELTRRSVRTGRWRRWRRWRIVLRAERGAAYSLAYVMSFVVWVLIVCLIIQCTLILIVKIGTVYAAYAAARSAIVWVPTAHPDQAPAKAQRSAVLAMAPFASSNALYAQGTGLGTSAGQVGDANSFQSTYLKFADHPVGTTNYVPAKFRYAQKSTGARIYYQNPGTAGAPAAFQPGDPVAWNAGITVVVAYDMPLDIRGWATILRTGKSPFSYRRIVSQVTLSNEGAQTPDDANVPHNPPSRPLGVNYDVP